MIRDQLLARSFERDCERLRPLGEAFVLRRFGGRLSRADAEDAVADVVIRLHRRMAEGRPPENLRATFFTSVRNAAIDQLRSRAAKPTVTMDAAANAVADSAIPVEHAESREDAVRLQEALQRMRCNYRETIILRFGLGLTVPEIARHLDISLPAAKKLVLRATRQVKKRLEAIEGGEFCPDMRELARHSLFEKHASGLASESEAEILRTHFEHCGACKSFLASLHNTLHDFGATALLAGTAADQLHGNFGLLDHLSSWAASAASGVQAGADKVRFAGFKFSGAFQSADAGSAGLLTGTSQKIVAICGTATATTATCLATGIVGPGIGGVAQDQPPQKDPAPVHAAAEQLPVTSPVPTVSVPEPSPPTPAPVQDPSPQPDQASDNTVSSPSPTPATQPDREFGVESSPPPAPSTPASSGEFSSSSTSSTTAATSGAGSTSSTSTSSSGGGGSSEFGFNK